MTGLIGVFGTLLGSASTYWVQRRMVRQQQMLAREERLRQERVEAYTAFAGAVTDYRRARVDRYVAWREENRFNPEEMRLEVYRVRAVAQEAEFRVHLLAPSATFTELATEALRAVDRLGPAGTDWDVDPASTKAAELEAAFSVQRDESRAAVWAFVEAARAQLDLADRPHAS